MTIRFAKTLFLAEWDWTSPELPVDTWWFFTIVLVLLVLFIWAVTRLTTATTGDIDPAEIDRQMLTAVSDLRSRGELTNEEFRSIKGRLVERLATDNPPDDPQNVPEEEDGEAKAAESRSSNSEPTGTDPASEMPVDSDPDVRPESERE